MVWSVRTAREKPACYGFLAGELEPDAGRIRWQPPNAHVVVCQQEDIEHPLLVAEALALPSSSSAARWCGLLQLEQGDLRRWSTLSPGERKRWQVGAALASEPDVLLLDEPSNHLDAYAWEPLAAALREFAGVGVIVSHQRELLGQLTTATLRVRRGSGRSPRLNLLPAKHASWR